jgi:hypothetical protein
VRLGACPDGYVKSRPSPPPPGFETLTVHLVASRYTNYSITVALPCMCLHNNPKKKTYAYFYEICYQITHFWCMILQCNVMPIRMVSISRTNDIYNHQVCQRIKGADSVTLIAGQQASNCGAVPTC